MPLLNSVTFNICKDNLRAARALIVALVAAGFKAEHLEVPREGHEHARAQGQKSPPAAVAHDAPPDVVVPLMQDIEDDHVDVVDAAADEEAARLRRRLAGGTGGSPTGPVGDPPPDR